MLLRWIFLSYFSLTSASLISQKIDVNYDKREAPQDFTGTVLNVTLRLEELSLIRVNDDSTIAWMLSYKMSWHDDRLRFSTKTWSGQSRFFMPSSHLWLPRLTISNALSHRRVGSETTQEATVHSDGRVTMRSKFYVETACGMNMLNFPFDIHDCPLIFSSFSLPISFMDIHPEIKVHRRDETFGDFALEENINLEENILHRGRDEFKEIRFVARLSRHSSSITVPVILPVSFLVILILALHHARGFQGDEEGVDKPTLITSTFLVFFLLTGLLTFFIPKGSDVSSLAYLLLGQLSLILCSLILSIASANRISRRPSKAGPLIWLYRLGCLKQPHQLMRLRLEETEKIVDTSSPSDISNGTSGHNRSCSERRRERLREEEWAKIHRRMSLVVLILLECFNLFVILLFFYVSSQPTPARINYN
ncbi:hypothetical protein PENTCL1PPCAC_7237 [Pristionchus entomophagus]|uniref:Neurotransmitter-gated ion-channel ligand-binding domain-containing protein n=1 Tax=Pristionchus entomophagus TaxID=358040 RepID=A0AAV5SNX6_9BILA|nr:hypothetical protein PENTCL1PPCAC_7237 [Pristionchus entomophagus]